MFSPLLIATIALCVLYLVLILYYFVGWLSLPKVVASDEGKKPFVSIIIPVRNESEHIKACLEAIFKQNYPKYLFEVIVVDDYSTDPTIRLAKEIDENSLLVLDLQQYLGNPGEYVPNKKKAISLGIKNAKGDLIITTDGDCIAGENWLSTMVSYYQSNNYKLITGPVMLKPAKNPFTWFQQLDVMTLAGITGATIRNGSPTMCNGANLMYSKATFHAVEGFKGNNDIPTGDDVFLMQKIEKRFPNSIGYVKSIDACVCTKPEATLAGFVSQRVRWASKSSGFGNGKIALVLYFAYFFNLFIFVNLIAILQPVEMSWLPLAVIGGTKIFVDFVFAIPVTVFFRKPALLLLLPIINVFHVIYIIIIGVLSLTGKYNWKERAIK